MRGYCIILTATALGACAQGRSDPASPESSVSNAPLSASSWGPETPPFNNEIILRDVTGNGGFGHVKFRQPNDADRIVYLDTWVRDLQPNTGYQLQRATDANVRSEERRVGKECRSRWSPYH